MLSAVMLSLILYYWQKNKQNRQLERSHCRRSVVVCYCCRLERLVVRCSCSCSFVSLRAVSRILRKVCQATMHYAITTLKLHWLCPTRCQLKVNWLLDRHCPSRLPMCLSVSPAMPKSVSIRRQHRVGLAQFARERVWNRLQQCALHTQSVKVPVPLDAKKLA